MVVRETLVDERPPLAISSLLVRPLGVIGRGEDIESLPVTSDGRVPVASLAGKSLAWFFEDRAPGLAPRPRLGHAHAPDRRTVEPPVSKLGTAADQRQKSARA